MIPTDTSAQTAKLRNDGTNATCSHVEAFQAARPVENRRRHVVSLIENKKLLMPGGPPHLVRQRFYSCRCLRALASDSTIAIECKPNKLMRSIVTTISTSLPVPSTVAVSRRDCDYFRDTAGRSIRVSCAVVQAMAYCASANEMRWIHEQEKLQWQRLRMGK